MLRFAFLPSDFHPLVLFLGETDNMRRFARLLQRFAQTAEKVRLETCDFCVAADEMAITLSTSGALAGMRRASSRLKALLGEYTDDFLRPDGRRT